MAPVVQALLRSSLVLMGLVLLGVGIGNVVAGRAKLDQYRELLSATAPVAPADCRPFPVASERDERHALARAKFAFYQLLMTAGQLLALGCVLLPSGSSGSGGPPLRVDSFSAN
jgi:hypothetical protein